MKQILHFDDHLAFLRVLLRGLLLGGIVGVLAGAAAALFLALLTLATDFRLAHPQIIWLLPLAGVGLAGVYQRWGSTAARGTNLVLERLHTDPGDGRIPLRMAPLILLGTVWTHLFGGSAGREGTAVQMGASLADGVWRALRLPQPDRRLAIMAGISGGFGGVFGTPLAGFVFGMEVQSAGRIRYEGVIPCFVSAVVADLTARWLGTTHAHYPQLPASELDPLLLLKVLLAGVAFGLTALLFIEVTHTVKRVVGRLTNPLLRPLVGGGLILLLTLLLGTQDYLGLSLPLLNHALDGTGVVASAFLLKLLFTAVTLGSGFVGGEVTPLFVIGGTLGYTLAAPLGLEPTLLAALGMAAVFAGASNTPLACTLMGIELFGGGAALYLALACFISYLASGHRGIYGQQRLGSFKAGNDGLLDAPLESQGSSSSRSI
jgi:H+/Cl- antiporter ClcA